MALPEQIILSDFIKSVHQKLRDDSKLMGSEKAWYEHCKDENGLEKYATAMKNLATNHWNKKYKTSKGTSRVEWVHHFCNQYFIEELYKQRQKEIDIAVKINVDVKTDLFLKPEEKLKVLDVGSCYNPFKMYSCFDVTAIDIAPASSSVYKCDFLNLNVTYTACDVETSSSEITELPKDYFHVVVFSLLLEYLPSPVQRYLCCEKAYNLLKPEGILVIITPDSKHVGANALIMKSWRFILAKLGFSRVKYEKLTYLHCMVFRKNVNMEVAQRWALLHTTNKFFSEIVIPQDFKKTGVMKPSVNIKTDCDISLFRELPCNSILE